MSRSRGWCFTINNYTNGDSDKVKKLDAKYVVCGIEKGDKEQTPHLQGYMYFDTLKSLAQVKKLLHRAHWEAAKGTGQQNKEYCSKEGNLLIEKGDIPADKAKNLTDWAAIRQFCKEGRMEEIDDKTFVQRYTTIRAIAKDYAQKCEPMPNTTGEWWYGPSGSGKSKTARETYPDAYIKGVNKWWDGYRNEEVVIIEDLDKFNVSMGGDLKRWCDHYSFPAEIKGGGMNIRPKKIIITSQYDIHEIWEDQATVDALNRRCVKRKFGEAVPEPAADKMKAYKDLKKRKVSEEKEPEEFRDYRSFYE